MTLSVPLVLAADDIDLYINERIQSIRDGGLKEVSTNSGEMTYGIGDISTIKKTGDTSYVNSGDKTQSISLHVGFDNLYVRSFDGRRISFDADNSIHCIYNTTNLTLQEAQVEKLAAICETHGLTYAVPMSDFVAENFARRIWQYIVSNGASDTEGEGEASKPTLKPKPKTEYEVNFSEDTIAFFEKLLNGEFCPYPHQNRLASSRRLTSVNGELTSIDKELATLSMAANTLVTDAVSRRMANVKGCLADPFVYALYGHSRRNESHGLGYSNDMGGFVVGI
ncbi:MAG: hypothetical protein LBE98_01460, partial [Puniceicoccales bacterium]|nr:hypothetical protein [Puniceicoccales bacterium]